MRYKLKYDFLFPYFLLHNLFHSAITIIRKCPTIKISTQKTTDDASEFWTWSASLESCSCEMQLRQWLLLPNQIHLRVFGQWMALSTGIRHQPTNEPYTYFYIMQTSNCGCFSLVSSSWTRNGKMIQILINSLLFADTIHWYICISSIDSFDNPVRSFIVI